MGDSLIDRFILAFDAGLKTVFDPALPARPLPAKEADSGSLSADDRQTSARLMRVNHCGEVCAQALYQGQKVGEIIQLS